MALPEPLERLNQISIDTLDLSESTSALLKWNGVTSILDCLAFFYESAHKRETGNPWPRLPTLMFAEVKPVLIAADYWELALDANVWRALDNYQYDIYTRRIERRVVHWQGQEIDLYQIPLKHLGLSNLPAEILSYMDNNVGDCLNQFVLLINAKSRGGFGFAQYHEYLRAVELEELARRREEYLFRVIQPRLAEMGFWVFVEAHVDDYIEEDRNNVEAGNWQDDESEWWD